MYCTMYNLICKSQLLGCNQNYWLFWWLSYEYIFSLTEIIDIRKPVKWFLAVSWRTVFRLVCCSDSRIFSNVETIIVMSFSDLNAYTKFFTNVFELVYFNGLYFALFCCKRYTRTHMYWESLSACIKIVFRKANQQDLSWITCKTCLMIPFAKVYIEIVAISFQKL